MTSSESKHHYGFFIQAVGAPGRIPYPTLGRAGRDMQVRTAPASLKRTCPKPAWVPMLLARLAKLSDRAWFAYGTILLLQLHRMWNLWSCRDLSGGDTSSYFTYAWSWFERGTGNFAWSPLYTWFYALWLRATQDAAVVTWLHRLMIALLATALVLAVLRRMLPHALAWLMAAWWAVLPINFDTAYEVHLFAVLPLLLAWWAIVALPGARGRGTALAVLLLGGLLVRNESLAATGLLALACAVSEWRRWRGKLRHATRPRPMGLLAAYFLPLLAALAISGWFYHHSSCKGPALRVTFHYKHVLNMAQVYAFGYQQRHPDWLNNPWTEFGPLCLRDFGSEMPTLWQMIRHNPLAYARHVAWNYSLLPNGLQLMLFNATSGSRNPDYFNASLKKNYAAVLSAIVIAILVAGIIAFWRQRCWWWPTLIRPRQWGWMVMASIAAVALLLVVPTQRPRPSYLFGLTVILMCIVGTALTVLFGRARFVGQVAPLMPIVMIALPLSVRSAYVMPKQDSTRPAYDDYERLAPYRALISKPNITFLGLNTDVSYAYVGLGRGLSERCNDYTEFANLRPHQSLTSFLESRDVQVFEWAGLKQLRLESQRPGLLRDFLHTAGASGWRLIGMQQDPRSPWFLFQRTPGASFAPEITGLDLSNTANAFYGWTPRAGWLALEYAHPTFNPPEPVTRWGLAPASELMISNAGGNWMLNLSGTSLARDQQMTLKLDGKRIGQYPIPTSGFADLSIALHLTPGDHIIHLGYTAADRAIVGIPRAVKFRQIEVVPAH